MKNSLFTILLFIGFSFVEGQENTTHSYYVSPSSHGTQREADPPQYVRTLSTLQQNNKKLDFLFLGIDSRARFEFRNNDIRRKDSFSNDFPLLLRQRLYLGFDKKNFPLHFALEFEDARKVGGKYDKDDRDVNQYEIIQGYVGLKFDKLFPKDDFGNEVPLSFRYGRMAFEFLDRRLIALNQWRNTTNNFNGLRFALGKDENPWQLDVLCVRPIKRDIENLDKTDKTRLFTAIIVHWRKWSKYTTIEPYYMNLKQKASPQTPTDRNIHSFGLRFYGNFAEKKWDYDVTGTYQFGQDFNEQKRAFALTSELGYTFQELPSKLRISIFNGYVSGDQSPKDMQNNRFERFFGFARPWSADDYIVMENILSNKIKLEWLLNIKKQKFQMDGGYSVFSLASKTDRMNNLLAGKENRNVTGLDGKFVGHNVDLRIRTKIKSFSEINLGYSHFTNGNFVKNRQKAANGSAANSSNFLYIELNFNLIDFIKFTQKPK
jgi:hypothetical protein